MDINPINFKKIDNIYNQQKQNTNTKPKLNNKNDKLEISQEAKYLNRVSTSNEEIDYKKIEEIRKKINSGTYNIDGKDIAKKMLEHMRGDIK